LLVDLTPPEPGEEKEKKKGKNHPKRKLISFPNLGAGEEHSWITLPRLVGATFATFQVASARCKHPMPVFNQNK
jgi:hypothetical protein